jgi:hypothetical protein
MLVVADPDSVVTDGDVITDGARRGPVGTAARSPVTASIMRISSSALCTRSAGALASRCRTSSATAGGTSAPRAVIGGTGRWMWAASTSPDPSPTNGGRPQHSS